MKKVLEKYMGVVFLYSVIIVGVLILNTRFKYLNEINVNTNVNMGGIYE